MGREFQNVVNEIISASSVEGSSLCDPFPKRYCLIFSAYSFSFMIIYHRKQDSSKSQSLLWGVHPTPEWP